MLVLTTTICIDVLDQYIDLWPMWYHSTKWRSIQGITFSTDAEVVQSASNRESCWIPLVWNNHHCCLDCVVAAGSSHGCYHLNFGGAYDHHEIHGLIVGRRVDQSFVKCGIVQIT